MKNNIYITTDELAEAIENEDLVASLQGNPSIGSIGAVQSLLHVMKSQACETAKPKGNYASYVDVRRTVYSQLKLEILGAEYRAGQALRAEQVTNRFEIEPAIAVDVLRKLCRNGLLEQHKSYWALPTFRESDFCRAVRFRVWSEVSAARTLAAAKNEATEDVLQRLNVYAGEMEEAHEKIMESPNDCRLIAEFVTRDLDFHLLITDSVQNGIGTHAVRQAFHFINLSISAAKKRPRHNNVINEHIDIVNAIESGDLDRVNAAYHDHFHGASYDCSEEVKSRVLAFMDEELRRLETPGSHSINNRNEWCNE